MCVLFVLMNEVIIYILKDEADAFKLRFCSNPSRYLKNRMEIKNFIM